MCYRVGSVVVQYCARLIYSKTQTERDCQKLAMTAWLMCSEGKTKLTSREAGIEMLHEERSHYQTNHGEQRSIGCDRKRDTVLMNTARLQFWILCFAIMPKLDACS